MLKPFLNPKRLTDHHHGWDMVSCDGEHPVYRCRECGKQNKGYIQVTNPQPWRAPDKCPFCGVNLPDRPEICTTCQRPLVWTLQGIAYPVTGMGIQSASMDDYLFRTCEFKCGHRRGDHHPKRRWAKDIGDHYDSWSATLFSDKLVISKCDRIEKGTSHWYPVTIKWLPYPKIQIRRNPHDR